MIALWCASVWNGKVGLCHVSVNSLLQVGGKSACLETQLGTVGSDIVCLDLGLIVDETGMWSEVLACGLAGFHIVFV